MPLRRIRALNRPLAESRVLSGIMTLVGDVKCKWAAAAYSAGDTVPLASLPGILLKQHPIPSPSQKFPKSSTKT